MGYSESSLSPVCMNYNGLMVYELLFLEYTFIQVQMFIRFSYLGELSGASTADTESQLLCVH